MKPLLKVEEINYLHFHLSGWLSFLFFLFYFTGLAQVEWIEDQWSVIIKYKVLVNSEEKKISNWFYYRVLWILKALWVILSETSNILRKLQKASNIIAEPTPTQWLSKIVATRMPWQWQFVPSCLLSVIISLKVLGKSVGLCKTTKRKDQLYIS